MNPNWGLAYGLVTLLLCVSVGNHPVLAQSSFTVGEGFITGSVWTNTYNSTIDPNALTNAYQRWAASVNVSVGDSLKFIYEATAHTVYMVSVADYTNCTTLMAVQVPDGVPTTYVVKSTDGPVLYFICTIPGHCTNGQKVAVKINKSEAAPGPVAGSPTSAVSPGTSGENKLNLNKGVFLSLLAFTSVFTLVKQIL